MRQALADIYQRMLVSHEAYVKANFRMLSYGMKEGSVTMKKAYPDTFARYFFRYVKAISNKKGTDISMTNPGAIKRRFQKMPAAFIISAGKKRCTMHEFSCPTEDCQYITQNKKIIMTSRLAKKAEVPVTTHRSRVFYRQDLKIKLRDIFMTEQEQMNCTFEPRTAALKPQDSKLMTQDTYNMLIAPTDHTTYSKKHGMNFCDSHPEVFKTGKLKRALLKFAAGAIDEAEKKLAEGFNISSLIRKYNPVKFNSMKEAEKR